MMIQKKTSSWSNSITWMKMDSNLLFNRFFVVMWLICSLLSKINTRNLSRIIKAFRLIIRRKAFIIQSPKRLSKLVRQLSCNHFIISQVYSVLFFNILFGFLGWVYVFRFFFLLYIYFWFLAYGDFLGLHSFFGKYQRAIR